MLGKVSVFIGRSVSFDLRIREILTTPSLAGGRIVGGVLSSTLHVHIRSPQVTAAQGLGLTLGLVIAFSGIDTMVLGLKQLDLDIAHGERIGRRLRIGEVRQRAADDQHRDEHDCDRSHQNGFLFHK